MRTRLAWVFALLALGFTSAVADAFPLRAPQVVFNPVNLQGYLNYVDVFINVSTNQLDAPTWSTAFLCGPDFSLVLMGSATAGDSVGVYNVAGGSPTRYQVFPGSAVPGWYATVHFGQGNLVVSRFDQNSIFMGQTFYPSVAPTAFGFYVQGACGTWYSQDALNHPAAPQELTYGSNNTPGNYWLCFETCPYAGNASKFDGAILQFEVLCGDPAVHDSWGHVKGLYR